MKRLRKGTDFSATVMRCLSYDEDAVNISAAAGGCGSLRSARAEKSAGSVQKGSI